MQAVAGEGAVNSDDVQRGQQGRLPGITRAGCIAKLCATQPQAPLAALRLSEGWWAGLYRKAQRLAEAQQVWVNRKLFPLSSTSVTWALPS